MSYDGYDDDNKEACDCKTLNEQRAEIDRRLEGFLYYLNEDSDWDGKVLLDALFAFARGIERGEGWKAGRHSGEESALEYPEVTRDLIAARKAKKAQSADRLHVVE